MNQGKYFARHGKVFGPFPGDEVEEMHASGRIRDFAWVWSEEAKVWQAMDPAPLQAPRSPPVDTPVEGLTVLCHNRRDFAVASVRYLTQTGCELHTDDRGAAPLFPDHAPVWLNVMEGESQKLLNMRAKVCGVRRDREGWRYQIRWENPPDFNRRSL